MVRSTVWTSYVLASNELVGRVARVVNILGQRSCCSDPSIDPRLKWLGF